MEIIDKKIFFHAAILQNLFDAFKADRFPHALLLFGNDGSGKLELAQRLAEHIVSNKILNPSPDKKRLALNKASKFIHPDIHYSFPFTGNNTSNDFLQEWRQALHEDIHMNITQWMLRLGSDNKQANINAKECNNIIQKLALKSFESEYKVLLMWLPEYLGKEGNRLLKLIEEPPENTVFILVAEQLDRILGTILSRCQLVKIPLPSDEEVISRLTEEEGLHIEKAREICFLAEGNYRQALNMSHETVIDFSEMLFDWLRICYKLNPESMVKWCDEFEKLKKEQQKYFIQYTLQFFRSFLLLESLNKSDLRFRPKELEVALKLKSFINLEVLEAIEELLNDSFMMIERNANVKMLFAKNSIRLNEWLQKASSGEYSVSS